MIHPWHDVTPSLESKVSALEGAKNAMTDSKVGPTSGVNSGKLPNCFRAIIEIPKGSSNKYELDKGTGMLKLDRVLSSAVYYPANYGFIPQTLAEDNDPLDVLVYCMEDIPPMTLCNARAVGMMSMVDHGDPDHKIIAVLMEDPIYSDFIKASDFPKHIFKMLRQFFDDYKMLEGKSVKVDEILPVEAAHAVIEDSMSRYEKARRTGGMQGLR